MEPKTELQIAIESYDAKKAKAQSELDLLTRQLDSFIAKKNSEIAAKQSELDGYTEVITRLNV